MRRYYLPVFLLAALPLFLSCSHSQPPGEHSGTAVAAAAAATFQAGSAETIKFKPNRDQHHYLFGCGKPVMKVNPGNRMHLWTEDAVNGRVKAYEDIATKMPETEG